MVVCDRYAASASVSCPGRPDQWCFQDTGYTGDGTAPPTTDTSGVFAINSSQNIIGVAGTGTKFVVSLAPIVARIGGSAVPANGCTDFPATYTGATTAMHVVANPAGTLATGWSSLNWGSAYVSAANTVQVHVCQSTAAAITPTAMNFNVLAF